MTKQIKLVPKRRFKEFKNTRAWEQRKFDEEVEFYSGLTYSPTNVSRSGTLVLRSSNVKNGEIVSADNVYVKSEIVNSSNVQKGDIIVVVRNGSRSLIGKHAQIKKDMAKTVVGAFMTGIRSQQSNFINTLLDTRAFKAEVDKNLGATINQITNGMFQSMQFLFPQSDEQKKIGNFFAQLDQLIINQQHKLEKTKALKSAYLSEMFPAEGELVPKRRLSGFTQDWEKRKFGELANIVRGASPRPIQDSKWFDEKSDIGWLRITDVSEQNGRIHYLKQRLSVAGQEKTRVLTEPHLLLSIAATVGKPVVNYVKTGVHDGFLIFQDPLFDREFMFQWLEMFRPKWQKYGQPGSQVNLNSDLVKNQEIMLPSFEEQLKIGNFFKQLDDIITHHQSKLEKLQNLKKAYLHEMFI